MARWRACAAGTVTLLAALLIDGAAATCPTFVAWLDASKNQHGETVANSGYSGGFVAVTVAPDRKSVVVNWQLTATSANVKMRSAGIYGPARKDQEKPMSAGVLLDIGELEPGNGHTAALRKKVESPQMEHILTFMREGYAYVNVLTDQHPKGAVRGQLVVPKCMDGAISPTINTTEHYGFAHIMASPDSDDKSVAFLIQAAPDTTGVTATLDVTGSSVVVAGVPVQKEMKADSSIAAGLHYHVLYDHAAEWEALSHAGQTVEVETTTFSANGGSDKLVGVAAKAHPCRLLSSVEDTLFTTAKAFGNDWLSVWSMNPGNPDHRRTLTPRYYAHPLEVMSGETAEQIMRRFGTSEDELVRSNPTVKDLHALKVGDTLCVVPNFWQTMGGNGAKICFM